MTWSHSSEPLSSSISHVNGVVQNVDKSSGNTEYRQNDWITIMNTNSVLQPAAVRMAIPVSEADPLLVEQVYHSATSL